MEDFAGLRARVPGFIDPPQLSDYAPRYAEHVDLQRSDGILVFRLHHDNGPAITSFPARNAWVHALRDVGADPENEVVIFTGTGDRWNGDPDRASFAKLTDSEPEVLYEHHFSEQLKLSELLLHALDVPTITAINGPVNDYTFGLLTDVTICTDTTVLTDRHYALGTAPGDGLGLSLQALMGVKRAAYAAYLCEPLDASRMLELGLVNEVVPRERLLARARTIAEVIMRAPRTARRATHALVSRPWKQLFDRDQGFHLAQQMYAMQLEVHGPRRPRHPDEG